MSARIDEIKKTFSHKIKFEDLEKIANKNVEVKSDAFYELIEKLTSKRKPSFKDKYESKWEFFYLPMERDGELICTSVVFFFSYDKNFYLAFKDFSISGGASVDKGNEDIPENYKLIFDEIFRFMSFEEECGYDLIEALFPYRWRTGKVKRKHITSPSELISKEEGEKVLDDYKKHLEKNLTVTEICYRTAFPRDIENLKRLLNMDDIPKEILHKQWADARHGGMLFLEDPESKKQYMDWLNDSEKWDGAHPFEIVYSGSIHGICLDPPNEKEPFYRMSVIDHCYNNEFLKMVIALMENEMPFKAYDMEGIVEYCTGEAYALVNEFSMRKDSFTYKDTEYEKEYFPHIEWDDLKILERSV